MFCPKCKAEYKEGVKRCGECEVSLVANLADVPRTGPEPRKDIEFVSVVRTFIPQDIAIIESILADSGIDYYIQGETGMLTYPLVDPASVMVVKDQADEARELLKDLKLGFYVFGPDHDEEDAPDKDSME